MPLNTAPKEQFEIPFIVWCSDKFIQNNKPKFNALTNNINATISQHDFFHSSLDCLGISDDTSVIKKSRSVCSSTFGHTNI